MQIASISSQKSTRKFTVITCTRKWPLDLYAKTHIRFQYVYILCLYSYTIHANSGSYEPVVFLCFCLWSCCAAAVATVTLLLHRKQNPSTNDITENYQQQQQYQNTVALKWRIRRCRQDQSQCLYTILHWPYTPHFQSTTTHSQIPLEETCVVASAIPFWTTEKITCGRRLSSGVLPVLDSISHTRCPVKKTLYAMYERTSKKFASCRNTRMNAIGLFYFLLHFARYCCCTSMLLLQLLLLQLPHLNLRSTRIN